MWQSSEGLPEDFTQAFAQTGDGYLWIGSSGGLARFDGVRFTIFNAANDPAFRDDSVYSLLVAADGTLWAGTEGGGLIRFRKGSARVFAADEGLTNPFVRAVYQDRQGCCGLAPTSASSALRVKDSRAWTIATAFHA